MGEIIAHAQLFCRTFIDETCGPESQYEPKCLSMVTASPSFRLRSPDTLCTSCQTWPLSRCRIISPGRRSMLTRCATTCFELSVAAAVSALEAACALDAAGLAPGAAGGALDPAVLELDTAGGATTLAAACGAGEGVGAAGAPVVADFACGAG